MPKSALWQHFTPIDLEKKVKCLYCSQQLSVANKSTCTLIRHLNKKHPSLKIRRYSSNDAQSPKEEILLIPHDDTDIQDSPGATILEYEIEDSEIEENNEFYQTSTRIISKNHRTDDKSSIEQKVITAMTEARKQIGDALISMKTLTNKRRIDDADEYDHFGHIIASKIRKIQDIEKREIVMHSVYNVVYEALMKNI